MRAIVFPRMEILNGYLFTIFTIYFRRDKYHVAVMPRCLSNAAKLVETIFADPSGSDMVSLTWLPPGFAKPLPRLLGARGPTSGQELKDSPGEPAHRGG
jgi:hypothetical protein